jgi:hypothetical protein
MRVTYVAAPPRDDRRRLSDVARSGGGADSRFASEGTSQADESVREEAKDRGPTPAEIFLEIH